jgi:hypothetical protein
MSIQENPVGFKPGTEPDPVEESARYVNHKWFQHMAAFRTECYRCHKESPNIWVNTDPGKGFSGVVLAFGDKRLLKAGNRSFRDITKDVQLEFAKHHWKFQFRRSYCPLCKDMGSV